MRNRLLILTVILSSFALARPKLEVMPELAKQVNAFTTGNGIPWYEEIEEEVEAKIVAKLDNLLPLVRTTHGNYHHTLYRVRFHSPKAIEGSSTLDDLTFYIERRFPTPESGIKLKELWPFSKGTVLLFKGNMVDGKLHIVSMESGVKR